IALQPYTLPPFTVAQMISAISTLYDRRIDINLVAGASPGELEQVVDPLAHDARYGRAVEYVEVLTGLLPSDEPRDIDGQYYRFRRLQVSASLDASQRPRVFVAGSSPAGLAA